VNDLAHELERTSSFLGAFIELHWEGSLFEQIEPTLRHENQLEAFATLIKAESLREPVVVYIEDAHWLDQASQDIHRGRALAGSGFAGNAARTDPGHRRVPLRRDYEQPLQR
jgi:hypothetical protein